MRLLPTLKIVFGFFIFFLSGGSVLATTVISPVVELEAEAGTVQPGVVKLYNETYAPIFLIPSVEEFTANPEDGQPMYIPKSQQRDFINWFVIGETSLSLEPGQAAVVPFVVNIPANAVPGGYYATIFWENVPPQQPGAGNVGVRSKVGTVVLLKVKGEFIESGRVVDFSVSHNQTIFYELPIIFRTRFENTGNIHLQPQGTVVLKNFWGQEKTFPLGDGRGTVLPNSIRSFDVVWGPTVRASNPIYQAWNIFVAEAKGLTFGKYSATLNIKFGTDNSQQASQTINFWVIPYHLITGVIVGLGLIIGLLRVNSKMKKLKRKTVTKNETPQP